MKEDKLIELIFDGPLEVRSLEERLAEVFFINAWWEKFIRRLVSYFGEGSRPSFASMRDWLAQDRSYLRKKKKGGLKAVGVRLQLAQMGPDRALSSHWKVPHISTLGDLAYYLEIEVEKLDWYAGRLDQVGDVVTGNKLSHYHLAFIAKRSGKLRVLEVPKWEMKAIQRRVLTGMLDCIPAHPCSHGFQKERSIFSFVEPHVGQETLMKFDLKDYFLTVQKSRVRSLFHLAGYPPKVSDRLSGICTHRVQGVKLATPLSWKYERYHLPQGAPTSPALADRLLYRVDLRLSELARKMDYAYTRYADDLAFSSPDRLSKSEVTWFARVVEEIVGDEGWELNLKKNRVMTSGQCQRLAGLVVNERVNVARTQYDQLRAILHRCQENGLAAENRDGHANFAEHLLGRISFVATAHPKRGEKLRGMFDAIR